MKIIKFALIISGFICFGLGTVGLFIPILPTTPFYLLAGFCFAKGSVRFSCWFKNSKFYKIYLEKIVDNRSMTLKEKLKILIPVSIILIIMAIFSNIYLRIVIIVLLLIKTWFFLFLIKTAEFQRIKRLKE